ncbi:MAG: hypothetical protein ACPGOV_16260 [Magnetovibrionaceae bacterium]
MLGKNLILLWISAFVISLGGCTFAGAPGTPVGWKASWFSYLNGDDIRRSCSEQGPERYRLVYNAVYQEQVRAYDVISKSDGSATMRARIWGEADLTNITLSFRNFDPFEPWRHVESRTDLRAEDLDRLKRALASDSPRETDAGRRLTSDNFFWFVIACEAGTVRFDAFVWPDSGFDQLAFPKLVFGWDFSERAINQPRKTTDLELYGGSDRDSLRARPFALTVGQNGLVHHGTLF